MNYAHPTQLARGGGVMERKPNHDANGRPYECDLLTRLNRSGDMIDAMCSERRPPRMSIPAGSALHGNDCWDEDLWIEDALDDAAAEIKRLRELVKAAFRDGWESGMWTGAIHKPAEMEIELRADWGSSRTRAALDQTGGA